MQLLNIANFFQIESKDDKTELVRVVISVLCNLETFSNILETPSDLKEILGNTDDPSSNMEKVMGKGCIGLPGKKTNVWYTLR